MESIASMVNGLLRAYIATATSDLTLSSDNQWVSWDGQSGKSVPMAAAANSLT